MSPSTSIPAIIIDDYLNNNREERKERPRIRKSPHPREIPEDWREHPEKDEPERGVEIIKL